MKYEHLTMQNYSIGDSDLTNQEKIEAFKIRSRMVEIKSNMNKYAIHAYTHGPVSGSGPR